MNTISTEYDHSDTRRLTLYNYLIMREAKNLRDCSQFQTKNERGD